ncbi:ABC transporter substrate-binding protein [Pseudoroseomonas ludipueritiae]|uniref:ABC transporter substrate-binding protein n=1 Tax=Pseudoroseomonas ludipueritiae TaxID=198093 RepID=A0ABR7RAY1_9PROT|nr:ABC transporter substrate-binding protein [Pseudoroseomonas ludipueritiae]MBC9178883.1 ABC transporter substrate-binding protein [Pseudoroseomonas ludipueritiae]
MLHRRALLAMAGLAGLAPCPGHAASSGTLRVGVLRFGTLAWELDTMARHGLAAAEGIGIEAVPLASNEAGRVALQAGTVDVIVGDWLWVARQRAQEQPLQFAPFSTSIGSVMVPAGSVPSGFAGLRGRRIGVSGGPLDKAWLLLVARARREGIDLPAETEPVYGAPPLLAEQLLRGRLDAALVFWNFAARLEAEGAREWLAIERVEEDLGAAGPVAMLGYIFDERWALANRPLVDGLLRASARAKAILREEDAEWQALRPQMQASSEAMFLRLRDRFRAGIPRRPVAAEEADAARLYAVMAELGGTKLVGHATTLPPGSFYRPAGAAP